MEIGDRIKRERKLAGLTQVRLAEIVGVDKSAVAQWEAPGSRKGIQTANLLKVADALGIPVGRLTGDDAASLEVSDRREIALVSLYRRMTEPQKRSHLALFYTTVGVEQPPELERHPPQGSRIAS